MAAPKPFTIYKPNYPAGINRGISATEGLVFFCSFDGSVPIDAVSGAPGVASGGPTFATALDGTVANLASASSQYFEWAHQPILEVLGPISLFWRGSLTSGSADRQFGGKHAGNGAGSNPFDFRTNNGASPNPVLVRGGTSFRAWQNSITLATGRVYSVSAQVADGTVTTTPIMMVNGVAGTVTNPDGLGTGAVTGGSAALRIGRRADGGAQMDGTVSAFGLWNVCMPPGAMAELHAKPFMVFRPSAWQRSRAVTSSDVSVALSGLSATGSIGTLGPQSALGLSGLAATVESGEFGVESSSTVALTGVEAAGSIGTLTAYIPPEVSENQGGGWIDPATARKLIRQAKAFQKAIDDKRADKERRQAELLASLERTYHAITGEPLPESAEQVAEVIAQEPATTPVQRVADAVAVYAVVAAMNDRTALDEAYEALDQALMIARIDSEASAAMRLVEQQDRELLELMKQGADIVAQMTETMSAALRL